MAGNTNTTASVGGEARDSYDFIVVGAGPAGCSVAWQLASGSPPPHILLVEAGGRNDDVDLRVDHNRWMQRFRTAELNWGYESAGRRPLDFSRGRGMGGTSAINFSVWTPGPREDWDEMARLTADDAWRWERVRRRFNALENFHGDEVPEPMRRYANAKREDHGEKGPLHIGFPDRLEREVTDVMDAWRTSGHRINLDIASGDTLGFGVAPLTAWRGTRATAADLLSRAPPNLHVRTDAIVRCVVFDDANRASGVSLIDGTVLHSRKEVILCSGSLDTPRILMHSGIGPADQLTQFGIPVRIANAHVGQHERDHYNIFLIWQRAEHTSERPSFFRDQRRQLAALREWQLFRSGELSWLGCGMAVGFFRSDAVLRSAEFAALPEAERRRLAEPGIPHFEVGTGPPAVEYFTTPESTPPLLVMPVFIMNSQAEGAFTLKSADPREPLSFADTAALEHPYDRRLAIEATRDVMHVVAASEEFQRDVVRPWDVPDSNSDEDILRFWREKCVSTWHMAGTCRMGHGIEGVEGAVIDTNFRVFGVDGLRVADLSVMPILPSCHTQSTAYQVGLIAAEKLMTEYGLSSHLTM